MDAGVETREDGVATAMTVLQNYKFVNEEGGGNTSSMDLMDFQRPFKNNNFNFIAKQQAHYSTRYLLVIKYCSIVNGFNH